MHADNYSTEQWVEQQHAEAVELLQEAGYYVLLTIDKKGNIRLLDGLPGERGSSNHDQHCAYSMLESFAKVHRKVSECEMHALCHDSDNGPEDDE